MQWGKLLSQERLLCERIGTTENFAISFFVEDVDKFRSDYYRDGDRVLFSSGFRRMRDKTQVYPLPENDHVHSRLTHSVEVATIGRSLGSFIGREIQKQFKSQLELDLNDSSKFASFPTDLGDIVYAACLAHDIGNTPFGHSGEAAIGKFFKNYLDENKRIAGDLTEKQKEDFINFEGNAQGFRFLTRSQDQNMGGLKLTAATLAAFCKYPRESGPVSRYQIGSKDCTTKKHGCFQSDRATLQQIAAKVDLAVRQLQKPSDVSDVADFLCYERHPLAFLMEAADNISYLILDLEDGIRLKYVDKPKAITKLRNAARVSDSDKYHDEPSYLRGRAINQLRNEVCITFMNRYEAIMNGKFHYELTKVKDTGAVDILANIEEFTRENCYYHRYVDEMAIGGSRIIAGLLEELVPAIVDKTGTKDSQRDMRIRLVAKEIPIEISTYERLLLVTDYIAGMTDGFAARLYKKLKGIDSSSDIR